jgi:hypothetical protein
MIGPSQHVSRRARSFFFALAVIVAASSSCPAADFQLSVTDLAGQPHRLDDWPRRDPVAFVFLGAECPISNGYIPELNRLYAAAKKSQPRIQFFGVISDRAVTRDAAAKHFSDFHAEFPVLFDASGELAALLKPRHTPEAFVVDGGGQVLYRGRIDDVYPKLGERREKATKHEFADAIEAAAAGKNIERAEVESVGCAFESASPLNVAGGLVPSFNRDIAPILQSQCMTCHRDGEVAPFPLTNYDQVKRHAKQIAKVTASRFMPPWKPTENFGHFMDERRLTAAQIQLLAVWAAAGNPEGNPADLPPNPKFPEGWRLGEPDLVLQMPEEFDIPAEGRDVFRNFVIPTGVLDDKLIAAAEFRPGNRRVVHHALFFLDNQGRAKKLDEKDPAPGYASFGGIGFTPSGGVGGWSPGATPRFLPDGLGRYMPRGSDLVLQVHYHPTGKPEHDRSTIALYFVKQPKNAAAAISIINRGFYLPPGDTNHQVTGSYTLPQDVTMVGVIPHMHLLGREMRVTATLPDGSVRPLVWVKDWSFNWQDQYLFAETFKLPAGTRLELVAHYDNSAANVSNPSSPPKPVHWGEQTTDEMCICFFLVSTQRPGDLIALVIDNARNGGRNRDAK